jgi:hypothetical protein
VNWQEITLPSFEKSKRNQGNTITETFDKEYSNTQKDNEKRKNGGKG